jgi:phosphate:Na+ symporter
MIYDLVSGVVGGLCIFLLGMKNMSEGMQAVAGPKLRRMVATLTDRRLLACATGAGVTALIQSSSVTAVMAVGMVNAGVMTLTQAAGVILGADIGTTITAWIVSLNVLKYGLPLLGVTGFVYLFSKNERVRYTFMTLMGVGMVFFGLQLMKHGLEPLKHSEEVLAWFSRYEPSSYLGVMKCVLIGAAITAIVQSSSATVAITITLARSEIIGYDAAVALVLGQNIGTTITAYLASLGASTNAKRTAYAHIGMKVIAVILMIPCFFLYMRFLARVLSPEMDIAKQIAFAHTFFNVMLVCLFLPLLTPFISFLRWLLPDQPHKEAPHLTYLDVRLLDTPAFGIQQSLDEIIQMGGSVTKMMGWLRQSICDEDDAEAREKKLFHRETVLDIMQKEIVEFLGCVLSGSVPHDVMEEARKQLRIADEYESVSDYAVGILKLHLKASNLDLNLSQTDKDDILRLHDRVSSYLKMISEAVGVGNSEVLSKARTEGDIITRMMKDLRHAHIKRLERKDTSALNCLIVVDMLQAYRKIKDHTLNIAEALAGEK